MALSLNRSLLYMSFLPFSVFFLCPEVFLELDNPIVMASLRYSAADESEDTLNSFNSHTEGGSRLEAVQFVAVLVVPQTIGSRELFTGEQWESLHGAATRDTIRNRELRAPSEATPEQRVQAACQKVRLGGEP